MFGLSESTASAGEAFAARRGVCQDFAHRVIAAARFLDIPSRYVSGYFRRGGGIKSEEAAHAWAEAFVEGAGWVGFDPANGFSPAGDHVRVAAGLDYLGAAPVRGTRTGGAEEERTVEVRVWLDPAFPSGQQQQ